MIRKNIKIIVLLVMYLTIISCAVNPVTGQKEFMLVSESQEIDMGREFYPNALWGDVGGGGEFRDEKLKAYLRDIVLRIHSISHRPNLPVDFAIQNSSVPNAWAIPGHVVITRGLVAALDNEAEFVFVMGHEMGHVSARHSARHMTYGILQQVGLGAAGLALQGKEYADAALGIGAVGSSLLLLKYNRDDELEADRLGIQYLARLGYDPRNAVSAHRNLERVSREYMQAAGKNPQESGFFEDLLSTHPRTSVRIEELQTMISRIQPFQMSGDGMFRERYQGMTAGQRDINKIYLDYYDKALAAYQNKSLDEAESLISKAINAAPDQPAFHTMKGFIMLKRKDYAEAEKYFDASIRIDRNYEPAYRGKGTLMYFREKYSEGIDYLEKSLSIFPQDILSHYFLGMSYYRTKTYKTAIPYLNQFAEVKPKHPEIHGILGICYENAGDLSSAYQEYALQLKVASDNEIGRHAASRAAALKPVLEKKK
ncbi:MAG: M48 family metalloprotease [Nitrospirota bacterium]